MKDKNTINIKEKFKYLKNTIVKENINRIWKIIKLVYKNYSDSETQILAISLTYFSLLALFPILALVLGITKGFGLDRFVIEKIFELVPQNEEMVITILEIANKLLKSAEGSVLAGVGIIILINSIVKLLLMLENSFNKIWHVIRQRSYTRRILDCVSVIFMAPIIIILLIGTNSFVIEMINKWFFKDIFLISIIPKILSPIIYIIILSLMFYFIPNTNVRIKPAILSGIIVFLLCYILKVIFVLVQSSITRYNAIYGSLAFVPIFLIWIQYVWITILLGAQISFSIQASDEFIYNKKIELPIRVEKELGLLILSLIIKRFKEKDKSPYSYVDLSKKLGIEVQLIKDILIELEKMKYINELVDDENKEAKYQIAVDPESFYITDFIEKYENKNYTHFDEIFDKLSYEDVKLIVKIRESITLNNTELIKDINI